MNNAEAIFSATNSHADVQNFLGMQENIFLDFKEREHGWNSLGKLADNEKRLYSKAASGFAHQQGGVVIWGVEARKNKQGVDQAQSLKPFSEVKQFKQSLEQYVPLATDPILDGIAHKIIFQNDSVASNTGFVVSYFPRSGLVHRALGGTTDDFYRRHGDSFVPLSTEDIRSLFFRTLAPNLEFVTREGQRHLMSGTLGAEVSCNYKFGLHNRGEGVAKFVSMYVGLKEVGPINSVRVWDAAGSDNFPLGRVVAVDYGCHGQHFILSGDIVIYPGQTLFLFSLSLKARGGELHPRFTFKLYAENMVPIEGEA
jgi:hypothetical protein